MPHVAASIPGRVYAIYEKVLEERAVGAGSSVVQRCLGCWTDRRMANEAAGRAWAAGGMVKEKGMLQGQQPTAEEPADEEQLFRKSAKREQEGERADVEVWVEEMEVVGAEGLSGCAASSRVG